MQRPPQKKAPPAGVAKSAPRAPQAPLPVIDLNSTGPLPSPTAASASRSGQIWLEGDVLMCACPDCHAPLAVRTWLMLADCWSCGTSIQLTEVQEREALELLRRRHPPKPHTQPSSSPKSTVISPASPAARELNKTVVSPQPPPLVAPPVSPLAAPPQQRPAALAERESPLLTQRVPHARRARAVNVPAWFVSFVFHAVLLTILGLLTKETRDGSPSITLSATVARNVRSGELRMRRSDEDDFDLPVPEAVDLQDPKERAALLEAARDARELQMDPRQSVPTLPRLDRVRREIQQHTSAAPALAGRDPRLRIEMVEREGGTTLTEAAVARGLRWLARHQEEDGRWSLHDFDDKAGCTCRGSAYLRSDTAATSLALFPFLGAGQTHRTGRYQDVVRGGLRWLMEEQRSDGDLRGNQNQAAMYAHGQAAIVLCEAYLMTGDETLRLPAQRAVDFIVDAQHEEGGWRYHPGQPGDTSVLGWQWMALHSARAAGLDVPSDTLERAGHYLDDAQSHQGARYAYQPGQRSTHVMTAEALLCRIYGGWSERDPALLAGLEYLAEEHPPASDRHNVYYYYYATQAFHHVGGPLWEEWNRNVRDILVTTQETKGHAAGSWQPRGPHADGGGRIYMTSLAICTLEVYYRHLPIFRQIALQP